jgi:cytochrome P450
MTEIYDRKKHEILDSKNSEEDGMDLMGAMMRTSGHVPGTPPAQKQDAGLSKDEIIGNAFILFLAGHETAANSIHFAMLLLATRPALQRKVQGEKSFLMQTMANLGS